MSQTPALRLCPLARAVGAIFCLAGAMPVLAQSLTFSQSPPITLTSATTSVMPNVIVALDMTGSMNAVDASCVPETTTVKDAYGTAYTVGANCFANGSESRYNAMYDSLLKTFSDPSLIGKFRLAFEATSVDAGFGPNRFNPSDYDNSMKVFTADYQASFMSWINNLKNKAFFCNPTEGILGYAGEYLRGNWLSASATSYTCEDGKNIEPNYRQDSTTRITAHTNSPDPSQYLIFNTIPSADSPWNDSQNLRTTFAKSDPDNAIAQAKNSQLSCRRSFTIFETDGGVNGNQFPPVGASSNSNYDKTTLTLPDGVIYNPSAYYGALYSDWSNNNYADQTLYYWATDLTGKGAHVVSTANSMPVAGNQTVTFTSSGHTFSTTFDPYWNPQNDPATWQHMQTYTVGFGTSGGAGKLPSGSYANPQGNSLASITIPIAFDSMYGNIFNLFATGALNKGNSGWPWVSAYDGSSGIYYSPAGDVVWDVLHAAYNGRGVFYPATSTDALSAAFTKILQSVISVSGGPPATVASATASSSALTSATSLYRAGYAYDSSKAAFLPGTGWGAVSNGVITGSISGWTGMVMSNTLSNTLLWSASIPVTRQIFTASSTGAGIPFEYPSTSGQQLNGDPSGIVKTTVTAVRDNPLGDIIDSQLVYVGLPSRVSLDTTYATFAQAMKSRSGVVYVGANDGMLHGFDAGNGIPAPGSQTDTSTPSTGNPGSGREVVAYVPRGLMFSPRVGAATLRDLSAFNSSSYTHQNWVDGSPFSGDAQLGANHGIGSPNNWGTVLVGTLGAGGPGYFVLDVTSPSQLTESNTASLSQAVLIDATDFSANSSPLAGQTLTNGSSTQVGQSVSNYLGSQFNQPVMDQLAAYQSAQIVQINTRVLGGEWAVIMGNGYNSASGVPVLLIQSLSQTDGRGHLKLYTVAASCTSMATVCQDTGNGLGAPRAVDVDGNGTVDIVYAGDLLGNLWKFDIASLDKSQWQVAYGGSPLFTAVGPSGAVQPITSAPLAVPNPTGKGGFMVVFGTGKNLGTTGVLDDTQDTRLNSIYALYDNQPLSATIQTLTPASGSNPAIVASQVTLGSSTATSSAPALSETFCSARIGGGTGRYEACLYQQGAGRLVHHFAEFDSGMTELATALPGDQTKEIIDGVTMRGWYYDLPELDNGNAAKVLANPVLLQRNTVVFFSQNVMSKLSTSGNASNAVIESCSLQPPTPNPALTTISLFKAATGDVPDADVTITIQGPDGPIHIPRPPKDNRFRLKRTGPYLQSGSNALISPDGGISLDSLNTPGQRAGWRMMGR